MTILFSIIIPTYNYGQFLGFALDSVFTQAGSDYEIVIVDDGSADDTADIAKEYCSEYVDRVLYICQQNQGPSVARNRGAMHARGQYLLFLDADDRLLPCALEKFRDLLSRGDVDFTFGGHLSISEDGVVKKHLARPLSSDPHTNFRRFLRKKLGGISHGATLIRKTVFERFKYPEGIHRNEDIVLFGQLLATSRCQSFPDPVVTIYKHANSLRNNVQTTLQTDIRAVDALFNPDTLPAQMMRMREEFLSRHYLTQFRVLHKAGYYREAQVLYRLSICIFPGSLLRLSNLWKYLSGIFRVRI